MSAGDETQFIEDASRALALLREALAETPPSCERAHRAIFDLMLCAGLREMTPLVSLCGALRQRLHGRDEIAGDVLPLPPEAIHLIDEVLRHVAGAGGLLDPDHGGELLRLAAQLREETDGSPRAARAGPPDRDHHVEATVPSSGPAQGTWTPLCDESLIEPFIDETGERLDALVQKLMQLEKQPGDAEILRDVFRDLHTIKGSSGFVGLRAMNQLAHGAEDVVGALQKGQQQASRATIDALLSVVDALRMMLSLAARRTEPDIEISPYLARLREVGLETEGRPAPAAPPPAAVGRPAHLPRPTLRVDFDKLDLLLNLVGELVVSKARLHSSMSTLFGVSRSLNGRLRRSRGRDRGAATEVQRSSDFHDEVAEIQRMLDHITHQFYEGTTQLDQVTAELRDQVMKLRMVPLGRVFNKHHRTVRELGRTLGKQVRLVIEGAETELDKMLVEQLDEPLMHLLRNAIDHGIEPPAERARCGKPVEGTIGLHARHRGRQITIEVVDDGAGIDTERVRRKALSKGVIAEADLMAMEPAQLLELIFRPGFSTSDQVSEISGRGVGMDVVLQVIQRLNGTIEVKSKPGQGSAFTLRLPLTLAIIQVLLVEVRGELYTLPLDAVSRAVSVSPEAVQRICDRDMLLLETRHETSTSDRISERGAAGRGAEMEVPLIDLAQALGVPERAQGPTIDRRRFPRHRDRAPAGAAALRGTPPRSTARSSEPRALQVILVEVMGATYGLICDRQLGKREIVIKSLGELVEAVPCIAGATLVNDRVVLLLDLHQIVQRAMSQRQAALNSSVPRAGREPAPGEDVDGAAPRAPTSGGDGSEADKGNGTGPAPRLGPMLGWHRRPRILLAEDSMIERESLAGLLRKEGCDVVTAEDGQSALEISERDREGFDLVSTDVTMPGLDGYELTRRLRAQERHKDVPILMLTSRSEPLDRVRGFDAGVDEYLLKPIEPARLLGAILKHLGPAPRLWGAARKGAPDASPDALEVRG